jgi:hypothetical protein
MGQFQRWIVLAGIACLAGCAVHDEPYCGGAYKSDAEMERALGIKSSADLHSRTVRY